MMSAVIQMKQRFLIQLGSVGSFSSAPLGSRASNPTKSYTPHEALMGLCFITHPLLAPGCFQYKATAELAPKKFWALTQESSPTRKMTASPS